MGSRCQVASSICCVFFFLMNTIWMEAAGPFHTAQVRGVKNTGLSRQNEHQEPDLLKLLKLSVWGKVIKTPVQIKPQSFVCPPALWVSGEPFIYFTFGSLLYCWEHGCAIWLCNTAAECGLHGSSSTLSETQREEERRRNFTKRSSRKPNRCFMWTVVNASPSLPR